MHPGSIVAISILTAIFFGALIALIFVLKRKLCKPFDFTIGYYLQENSSTQNLVENVEPCSNINGEGELGEENESYDPNDVIYKNEIWVNSAIDLVPHCLGILKISHQLTDKIIPIAMQHQGELQSPEILTDLISVAKRIGLRVDDVVRSMYPPMDPRLLEARCSSLVLSVHHLVMLAKTSCHMLTTLDWVDQLLADVEEHLKVLSEFSLAYEKTLINGAEVGASRNIAAQDSQCNKNYDNSNKCISNSNGSKYSTINGISDIQDDITMTTLIKKDSNEIVSSCQQDDNLTETSLSIKTFI